ncbi:hypothetical protein HF888_02035 [Bermanella marisrubri]|uniref:Uncharacterized protein n=1 Tax=Bermanella marisrubri TaxID=207949 RepID=Q1MXQ7_9GAMM|nr:DUF6776 family protein [Bermanella marisrubri]EAT10760.1 hypothetical protein RED65_11822 [Oceanobacter sp. RED65] [Bermanella marisrubri]QIZ83087.1 hypothetical protein HF888_02035 [Bermanella marisrubri]
MAVVKGSKQNKLTVVSYDPWSRFWRRLLVLILITGLAIAGYFYGRYETLQLQAQAIAERDQLLIDLEEAEEKIASYSQRVIMLEKGGEVDRRSTEGLRQNMVDLREQIATLQEEVAFYKGIMAPSSRKQDLRVQKVEIDKTLAERTFRYKIVVTQVGTNQTFVSGLAGVNVVGALNGQQKTYGLRDVSDDVQDYGIKYRFRYFQEIEGEMVLPEGFEPEYVEVILQSSGSRSKRLEKSFPWPGKEQANAEQ